MARFWCDFPIVLACPRCDRVDVNATLQDLEALEETIVFETTAQDVLASRALRMQVRSWNIDELAAHYSEFIQLFRPLWQALRANRRRCSRRTASWHEPC